MQIKRKITNSTHAYKHAGTNPEQVLQASLVALPDQRDRFQQLFEAHPRSRQIAISLAGYMTNAIPLAVSRSHKAKQRVLEHNPSGSLLTHCLKEGISAWDSETKSIREFLIGTFTPVTALATWQAYVGRSRTTKTWDFCAGPLHTWMNEHCSTPFVVQRPVIVIPPLDDHAVRSLIAVRILSPEDFMLIDYKLDSALPTGTPKAGITQ